MSRPNLNEYFLNIAEDVSSRSTCIRRQYGAVLVKDKRIISTGYNGSPAGEDNCCDVGYCWREANNIPHGERYEQCVAIHAEANAITQAGLDKCKDATLYLVGFENNRRILAEPCVMCKRLIVNSNIKEVYVRDPSGNTICIYKKPEL